jgi:predicted RNA binding protein YcfA (HicA-like mRNA interferase family)
MSKLPAVDGKKVVRILQRAGFRVDRIEGSHHILVKASHPISVPVPVHGSHPLPKGTLRSIIRMAGMTRDEFISYL